MDDSDLSRPMGFSWMRKHKNRWQVDLSVCYESVLAYMFHTPFHGPIRAVSYPSWSFPLIISPTAGCSWGKTTTNYGTMCCASLHRNHFCFIQLSETFISHTIYGSLLAPIPSHPLAQGSLLLSPSASKTLSHPVQLIRLRNQKTGHRLKPIKHSIYSRETSIEADS